MLILIVCFFYDQIRWGYKKRLEGDQSDPLLQAELLLAEEETIINALTMLVACQKCIVSVCGCEH